MSIEEFVREQIDTEKQASEKLPSCFSSVHALIDTMPAERRAEVYQVANAIGLSKNDELLYSLLVGLGYHKTMLTGVPDEIRKAGSDTSAKAQALFANLLKDLQAKTEWTKSEIITVVNSARNEFQEAAMRGAQNGVEKCNLEPILNRIAESAEAARAKIWFSKAVIFASAAIIIALTIGVLGGWYLKRAFPPPLPPIPKEVLYMTQLKCGAVNKDGLFACIDNFGGRVTLRQMREGETK